MEIAAEPDIPTYAGGLGMLAGDSLRAAADIGLPMVGVTLLYRRGYFDQILDEHGDQTEAPVDWRPGDHLERTDAETTITIEGRTVRIAAWRYTVRGLEEDTVPIFFLDTDLEGNDIWDRTLTHWLYGGDKRYRLCQELVLGKGGAEMLRAMGFDDIEKYHMNEGHSALLTLDLLEHRLGARRLAATTSEDLDDLRKHCVFTTHTPVPAGHDRFSRDLAQRVLGEQRTTALEAGGCFQDGELNMTYVALRAAGYINGVAMEHGEISRGMFPNYSISAITNGVHAHTWVAPPFAEVYDRHVPDWRRDNLYLRYAKGVPLHEIQAAHAAAKRALLTLVAEGAEAEFSEDVLTIGFARRAASYKRLDLLFSNVERLNWIARNVGPIQLIFAGKAHPQDAGGKEMIRRVFDAAGKLDAAVRFRYLPNHEMSMAQSLVAGVDVWLNTPQRPEEASGTSGMKAALNGVPSLSVLDGWWIEGHSEGVTGWAVGDGGEVPEDSRAEADSLYGKLEHMILPMYYGRPTAFAEVMRSTISVNGSFFTARRMMFQYLTNAYGLHFTVRKAISEWR
jgi:starch phosphorylase